MKSFKDISDRTWNITVNVGQIKRLRDRLNIDIAKLFADDAKIYLELVGDPVAFVDLIYVLCEEQVKAVGITDIQFGEAFNGDVFQAASDAFYEEMLLFFPKRQREALTNASEKLNQARDRATEMATERVNSLDIEKMAEKMLSGSALNSLESLELTRTNGRSVS